MMRKLREHFRQNVLLFAHLSLVALRGLVLMDCDWVNINLSVCFADDKIRIAADGYQGGVSDTRKGNSART